MLPTTFVNEPRHRHKLHQNAMAIAREYSKPDIFLTFTCSPKWSEITNALRKEDVGDNNAERIELETVSDRPGMLLLLKPK